MSLHLRLLLLAAVTSTIVHASTQSGNSQAALDHSHHGQSLTAPAELVPVSAENLRFSRLLKDTANVLQFSSISNDAPPIWGIQRDGKKEGHREKKGSRKSSSAPTGPNFGRRSLDYDEQISLGLEESTSESKIVANPYPGNEYVYVRPGKLEQRIEHSSSEPNSAASVTSINNKPPRVPLAILRQKKGKRVNITPIFTEVPEVSLQTSAKEFVWVDQPHHVVAVNRQGRKHGDIEEITTNPAFQDEDIEATTIAEEVPIETTTLRQKSKPHSIVNIVTSEPRFSVESSVGQKRRSGKGSRRLKASTSAIVSTSTTTAATTSTSTTTTTEAIPETTTLGTTTTTFRVPPTTTVAPLVLSSSSARAIASADLKENLVTDAFHRSGTTFHGFHDNSQTKLQAAESNQPARVNVRPAQNGKEYEYEYIYYYYDDDDENNNGEKRTQAQAQVKAVEHNKENVREVSSPATSTSTTSAAGSSSSASSSSAHPSSSSAVVTSSTSTTSTTTISPVLSSDADFEYEDDAVLDEDDRFSSPLPEVQKSSPSTTRTTDEPIITKGVSSAEKLSNSNPINQLDRSRSPKILPGKFEEAVADYKLETEASQEEEVIQNHAQSRGQPQRQPPQTVATSSEEDEEEDEADASPHVFHTSSREPSTSSPAGSTTSDFDISHMSTLAKTHKDSVNTPIILKQSNLLKAVPVSQVQPHQVELTGEQPQPQTTVYTVTPVPTTTTTTEASSEPAPAPSARPGAPRLRAGSHRLRGSVTPRPSTTTSTTSGNEQKPTEEKPAQAAHRPNLRGSQRRIPSRRPVQEAAENIPEQQPAASPIIENHARPLPIRPRFPPRTHGHQTTTVASPVSETVSDSPVAPVVTVSAAELNSLEDKKAKDAHVRAKSANDLFAFARLQQAISSRAPSRIPPKLVAGFVNSGEVTTESITSSEVTTVSSFGGQSSETVSDEPSTTTTTSTTTEAVQLDKFGRQRVRFGGGRTRRPLGGGTGSATTSTTEAPSTPRGRFGGGARRRTSTTEAPASEGAASQQASSNAESPKPKLPTRNRFASRNRGSSTTTEATVSVSTSETQKQTESDRPSTSVGPGGRRRPGAFGGGRRRPNQIQQAQTEAPAASSPSEDETNPTSVDAGATPTVTSTAAPATPAAGRNRINFPPGGRPRPGAGGNPLRLRGGGRLRGPTSTTTEAAPETEPENPDTVEPDQSQSIQNENIEQAVQSTPAPEAVAPPRGSGGVLGRLKNRPKLVVTTGAPDSGSDRKPNRLGGLLGRRKNLGQLTAAAHKEEVKETVSEGPEEDNDHALEQTDEDHRGVVVQVSSSVTESEEFNEAAGEVQEAPSTTPASILNRLKSQRKPGSLFRKKPDPHGE